MVRRVEAALTDKIDSPPWCEDGHRECRVAMVVELQQGQRNGGQITQEGNHWALRYCSV